MIYQSIVHMPYKHNFRRIKVSIESVQYTVALLLLKVASSKLRYFLLFFAVAMATKCLKIFLLTILVWHDVNSYALRSGKLLLL